VLAQIEHLEKEKGIECFVPISHNQQQLREIETGIGFSYDSIKDIYTCTQGEELHPIYGIKRDRRRNTEAKIYQGVNCTGCEVKLSCTASEKGRSIARQSNQEWKDQYFLKMKSKEGKEKMRLRRMLSEHPFGTIKYWMGQIPLLTRGLQGVQTEVTIYTIAYNFRRWLSLESFDNMKERIAGFNWKLA
jgi:hypothetical protein